MRQRDLLAIWDHAGDAGPADRAVVLAAGFCETPVALAAARPVGERDAALLEAHHRFFATRLDLVAYCPACAKPAEFAVAIGALLAQSAAATWPLRIPFADGVLTCHRPSTLDLARAWAEGGSLEEARLRLCDACVSFTTEDEAEPRPLTPAAIAAASAGLDEADPLANIAFGLTCPACAAAWHAPFDPTSVLWRALDRWARTALDEVGRLARGYGWSEQDIMAMHPNRRRYYLERVS
jgi:hypothetical protein